MLQGVRAYMMQASRTEQDGASASPQQHIGGGIGERASANIGGGIGGSANRERKKGKTGQSGKAAPTGKTGKPDVVQVTLLCCICLLAMTAIAMALLSFISLDELAKKTQELDKLQAKCRRLEELRASAVGAPALPSVSKENGEWMEKVLKAFGGTSGGGANAITNKDLDKMLNNPLVYNVSDHLQVREKARESVCT